MSRRHDNLKLNHEDRRFLGVCAGIADYFDVPAALVRIIFVICIIFWPPMLVVYFGAYFCMDRNITSQKIQDFFNQGMDGEHFRKLNYSRPLYRNTSNSRIAGVCSGIADYLDVKPLFVRAAFILSLFIFGPFGFIAYIVCWIAIAPDPSSPRYASHHEKRTARRQRREEKHMTREQRRNKFKSHFSSSRINVNPQDSQYSDNVNQGDALDENYAGFADVDSEDPASNEGRQSGHRDATKNSAEGQAAQRKSLEQCAEVYYQMESRMREIEAYITSKRFRLHCEINRA